MAATIKIKNSSTASAVPTSSDLVQGELAVNVTDKRIFTENASGTVVELGTNPSILTLPDGSASAPTLTNDGDTNTGIFFPAADTVGITTGGTERLRVDSAGNLGLGVTPSAWGSTSRAMQFQSGVSIFSNSSGLGGVGNNVYSNPGTGDYYIANGYATRYYQYNGTHVWNTAASGTAGNTITFTQAMTLDASGNLGVGTTSPANRLSIGAGSFASATSQTTGMYTNGTSGLVILSDAYSFNSRTGTGFMTIDSSGNLLVGATSAGTDKVRFASAGGTANQLGLVSTDDNSGNNFIVFRNSAAGGIGNVARVGTTNAVVYNTTSDYRLKTVIGAVSGAGERIDALKPVDYQWTEGGQNARGFLAHEFAEVYANSVTGEKDAVDGEGTPIYQSMQASTPEVIADLVAEIQSLRKRITALEQA